MAAQETRNPSLKAIHVGDTTGTTSRLNAVEVSKPPITAIAMGWRKLASAPSPSASGNMPTIMATVVITIGRARL
jgi:hypothetical protein